MTTWKLAAGLLLSAMAAAAQPAPPELRIEAVDGGSVIYVKNRTSQPLTAFLIELVNYPGSNYWMLDDAWQGGLAPGAEKRFPVSNMTIGASPEYVKITAALFADGAGAGDPAKVAKLVERRRAYLETAREVVRRIEAAQSAGKEKAALVADLRQWSDSQRSNARTADAAMIPAARRAAIDTAVESLNAGSFDKAIEQMRAAEKLLAGSKPPL
jgi:hypothetical protein